MTPKLFRQAVILALVVLASTGCTQKARMERHLGHGDQAIKDNDYDKAELEYRSALLLVPGNAQAIGSLGLLFYNEGRIVPAYALLRKALELDPKNDEFRLVLALASFAAGRTAEARSSAKVVLESRPDDVDALLLLAGTSVTSRDSEESLRIIEKILAGEKDSSGCHVGLGALKARKHDFDGAESEFRKAISLDANSAAAYCELGSLQAYRGDPKQAAQDYRMGSDLSPLRSVRRMKYIDFLIRSGSTDEASRELAAITAKAPDYLPALIATMDLAYSQRRYDDCLAAGAKIIARDPSDYGALLQVARVKLIRKDTAGAVADLKRLEGFYESDAQVKYELALAYLDSRDPGNAEDSLGKAIILAPDFEQAVVLMAEINLGKGSAGQVVTALEPIVRRGTRSARAYFLLAQAYRANGNLAQCLETFQVLEKASPKAPDIAYLVAMVLSEMGRKAEAREHLDRSVRLAPNYWPAQEALVDMDLGDGREAAAAGRADALVLASPRELSPYLLRAKVRAAERDFPGAESDLQQAIDLNPNSEYAYVQLARIYFQENQAKQAAERLEALVAKTRSTGAMMQLGMLYGALGRHDQARAEYEALLASDPKFVPALNNLAALLAGDLGQAQQALPIAKKARELAPGDPVVADTLGWVLVKVNDRESALPLLQEASQSSPADPEVSFHLGMAHYMLGQEEAARPALQAALGSANPDVRDEARRRLAVLALDPAVPGPGQEGVLKEELGRDASDPVALIRLAALREREGSADQAAASLESALKVLPRSASTMAALARIYFGPLKNHARASELAKAAHDLAPNDANISWTLGRVLYDSGEFSWAADLLQQAEGGLPGQKDLLLDLARATYATGRVPEAADILQRLLASDPPAAVAARAQQMADMISAAESPEKAQASQAGAFRILATTPGDVPALMVSAIALEHQGDYHGAEQAYDRILAQDPTFAPAARLLAILCGERLGNDRKAEEWALSARRAFPDDPDLNYELGSIKFRNANYTEAVPFFQHSLSRRSDDANTAFSLGMCYYELKNAPEARSELNRALELNLSGTDADDAKRVLEELDRKPQLN